MSQPYHFIEINEKIHGILNYEQQHSGNIALVMCPLNRGQLEIYQKLRGKSWDDAAIHERLFPQHHLAGKWSIFCKEEERLNLLEQTYTKSELVTQIREHMGKRLRSLDRLELCDVESLHEYITQCELQSA